ncbi:shikimate dehydrogenase [Jatrophihabitans endophyticus]|uniref:Shikimate dehydrogenase n=1 Tax=Jatrophihabitans endophyticus TaxID=1206085 RepID=A0A1M5LM88_9ACTN|nr:shikimate dehydrogenase [Jatrophihabitans endophyticus]SHG66020.1 shikimate dehydrogenase [Jatrophihabitans endophyticus]
MTRAGVLGRPIAHSLSPALHRAAYGALGLAWTYEAIDCGVADLPAVLAARHDWRGFSCTMPLKHAVLAAAAEVRPVAAAVGSANTLLPGAAGWIAENTDVDGVLGAWDEAGIVPLEVTVLGAGGTAQAVVAALARRGVDRCTALVRDRARAADLLATGERLGVAVRTARLDVDAPALAAPLVVSTLPAGAADAVARRRWDAGQALLDVVYAPWPTALARAAAGAGATVVGGAAMLLHQAARQVELMTGRPAPLPAMRDALPVPADRPPPADSGLRSNDARQHHTTRGGAP